MSYKIKFTDTAKEDLRRLATYIAEKSGEKSVAINFVNELREKIKMLEAFPECGAFPTDHVMKSAEYRFLVHRDYLIFYRYMKYEETSYILTIFNSKQDYMQVMKKFL